MNLLESFKSFGSSLRSKISFEKAVSVRNFFAKEMQDFMIDPLIYQNKMKKEMQDTLSYVVHGEDVETHRNDAANKNSSSPQQNYEKGER